MREKIHPEYHKDAVQECSCGAIFHIPSTKKNMKLETCSNCHPFYTGRAESGQTAGQIEKFRKRMEKAQNIKGKSQPKKKQK